ncbi:MAG TPA: D-hexose-6-phosphate mutarotase, partial [Tichowtungia sp.]|nr:D-hexose-6-phosphate mutarotase [Tichowtungia sp.]
MKPITEKTGQSGLPYLELCHNGSVAHIYLHGAHVLHYQPAGEKPVLWHSRKSAFEAGQPIRGGVPLCWPWFCAHPSDKSQPFHGPVRLSKWTLKNSALTDESTSVTLQSPAAGKLGFSLELTVELGRELTLTLAAKNISDGPLSLTEALHTYFAVGDIPRVSISGLDGVQYIDKTADEAVAEQAGEITFSAETNRIYFDTAGECIIHDPEWNRR